MNIIYKFTLLFFVSLTFLNAQATRGLVNDGVDEYEENKFAEAEVNFKKGIEADVENFESRFNLGDAIYKQGRFEEALEEFKNSMPLALNDESKSSIFHNIGNTLLKSQKLQESIGAYREALKLNPNDMETKYNLSYAIKQMQNQQDNKQDQDKNDQNQDQKDQNKDKQEQDKNEEEKEQDQKEQNKDQNKDQQQQPQEPKDEISKDEAQRILDALKNNEAELQKKMREHKAKKTNVEKDW
jgi:Ca-activated chloride channel homolog